MPYIGQEDRNRFEGWAPVAESAGELNYQITSNIDCYLAWKGINYQNINEVIGVLECAKLELYRRIAAPYENKKKEENGDVYSV